MNDIADKLRDTAERISSSSELADVRTSLKNQALHLRSYQDNLVKPMVDQTIELQELAKKLNVELKFNRTSFEVAINELKTEIREANKVISGEGTNFVQQVYK